MKTQTAAILAVSLAFVACGRPEIKIDSSNVESSQIGSQPVGLLEVHRANSGISPGGISIGEAWDESVFCSATLLVDGRLATSTDCVQRAGTDFETGDMEFHLNRPGSLNTEHIRVSRMEKAGGLTYVSLDTELNQVHRSRAPLLSAERLPLTEKESKKQASVVVLPSPDKDGFVTATLVSTEVEFSPTGFTYTATETSTSTSTSTTTRTVTNSSTRTYTDADGTVVVDSNGNNNPNQGFNGGFQQPQPNNPIRGRNGFRTDTRTSTSVHISTYKLNNAPAQLGGSPIFLEGKLIGVMKQKGSANGLENVHWADSGSQRAPTPEQKPALKMPGQQPQAPKQPTQPPKPADPVDDEIISI
jgi:hypothetical protein